MSKKYECNICSRLFDSEELCLEHLENEEEISSNAEIYMTVHEDLPENLSEGITEEDSEETPDETTEVIEERDLLNRARAKIAVDSYFDGELDDTEEKQLLSRLLGLTTKSADKYAHDKVFKKPVKIENFDKEMLSDIMERISYGECPFCHLNYKQQAFHEGIPELEQLNKNLIGSEDWRKGMMPSPKQITESVSLPMLTIIHIQTRHPKIWEVVKDLWKGEIPESRIATTPNPENLNLENLSEEEIYQQAIKNPEFRKLLFKRWISEKQKRKTK